MNRTPWWSSWRRFVSGWWARASGPLWFKLLPARVFMGDTGSMAIGGCIAATAICCKQEVVLLLVGGVFVIEAMSVMMQVSRFKISRRLYGTPRRLQDDADPSPFRTERLEGKPGHRPLLGS